MYQASTNGPSEAPVTAGRLRRMKAQGEPIACLTAYDYALASAVDAAGVDLILVGDSLGMVIQGRDSTIPVTVDDVVYHTRCVAAARPRALIMADMPFLSYVDCAQALRNAGRLMQEGGAQMVKLEGAGGQVDVVAAMTRAGIPVCAHVGLQPQLVHKIGGYRVQGREADAADAMVADALALEAAGADLLLVECVPRALGARLAQSLGIPVIGIGAGPECDGQILVLHDMLAVTPRHRPRFSRDFLADSGSIPAALEGYVAAVRAREFPGPEHCF